MNMEPTDDEGSEPLRTAPSSGADLWPHTFTLDSTGHEDWLKAPDARRDLKCARPRQRVSGVVCRLPLRAAFTHRTAQKSTRWLGSALPMAPGETESRRDVR